MSDSKVLDIAFGVISREGFDSFTFDQVSRATGLSPAGLVKRFKSKKNLALLARNQKWDQNLLKMNTEAIKDLSGIMGVFEFINLISQSVDSKRLGEHAQWLGKEAGDLKSKRKVADYFERTRKIFERLLVEAVSQGELSKEMNPKDYSITLEALVQGSIFQFAFMDKKNIDTHLKDRIFSILNPYLIDKNLSRY